MRKLAPLLAFAIASCGLLPPPEVEVTRARVADVPITADFEGVTAPVESVEINARVEGYLLERLFRDGQRIAQNDLLFIIQQDEYRAAVAAASASLARDESDLARAKEQVEAPGDPAPELRALETRVATSRARLAEAELDLAYTEVRAPIDGRIGRHLVDVGNLVGAGTATPLARIVNVDPILIYFSPDISESSSLRESHQQTPLEVQAILPNSEEPAGNGRVDFIDTVADPANETIRMRARVPNPGNAILAGQRVTVRVLLETIPAAVLVPESALVEDHGYYRVFVIGADDIAEARQVEIGLAWRGLRVIRAGVKPGERVLLNRPFRVRDGSRVNPSEVPTDPATAALLRP